jgi:hypothetical protein
MIKPTFIIAGPPKAGTSSLQHYIDGHPDIYIPEGEAHFFCDHYEQGLEYYTNFFNGWSGQKAVGEKTPCYFYIPGIPERIAKDFPDIKLLFIYRNPIDRAYSQYWHNVRRGVEHETFDIAVRREIAGITRTMDERVRSFYAKEPGLFSYVAIGRYSEHLRRWTSSFGRSQMFHVVLEDITVSLLHDVLRFLDVDDDFAFGDISKKFNVGGSPRSTWLINKTRRFENNKLFHDIFDRFINFKRGEYPEMNSETRRFLQHHFKESNSEFERITGRSAARWQQ